MGGSLDRLREWVAERDDDPFWRLEWYLRALLAVLLLNVGLLVAFWQGWL